MIKLGKIRKPLLALLATLAIAVATFGVIAAIHKSRKLTDFEYSAFVERSTKIMNFFELIDTDEQQDPSVNQIVYALERLYADTGRQEFSISDIQNVLDSSFIEKIDAESYINEVGNLSVPEYQVFYDKDSKKLSIEKDRLTHQDAIHTPITKYILKSVTKKSTTYIATYDKYVFDDPYQIINRTSLDDTTGEHSVNEYLSGGGTNLSLKELLNETNAPDIREPNNQITVTFSFKNDKLLLEKYE